ncbi:hypothetical protein AYX13_04527 [Cryptococcus neoformans]|nr:hypothetical protein AYX13_04527 [Cryptococcus neoformans var. grubii]
MTRNSLPHIQTRLDIISAAPNVPHGTHKKEASSDSSNREGPSVDANNGRDNQAVHQHSGVFSPPETTFGLETPQVTSPEVTSPDTSMIAVHGSVLGSPFPPGMSRGKHGRYPFSDWEYSAVAQRKEVGIINAASTNPTDAIPEHDAEVEVSETPKDFCPAYNDRIIAIDFDDVCTQNMLAMIAEHNAEYGTDLTLGDLETYVFWQNRGWGSPADVARKVKTLNRLLPKTAPIPGFAAALRTLHSFGHPIHIVTSRPESDREAVAEWLEQEGITIGLGPEDVIAAAWFTGTYSSAYPEIGGKGDTESAIERENVLNDTLKDIWKEGVGKGKGGLGKLKVLRCINAALFVDDHYGNLEPITKAEPPIPCLLFGTYGWNRSRSGLASPVELMDYDERTSSGLAFPFEEIMTGKDHGLHRTETWNDVIKWVKEWDRKAMDAVC